MADSQRTTLSVRERSAPETALVPAEELKEHLPGVEPERRLNDWGRSERIEGLYDRLVADFFYRYWFRAEVEGIENVPSSGGALIVSNHSCRSEEHTSSLLSPCKLVCCLLLAK